MPSYLRSTCHVVELIRAFQEHLRIWNTSSSGCNHYVDIWQLSDVYFDLDISPHIQSCWDRDRCVAIDIDKIVLVCFEDLPIPIYDSRSWNCNIVYFLLYTQIMSLRHDHRSDLKNSHYWTTPLSSNTMCQSNRARDIVSVFRNNAPHPYVKLSWTQRISNVSKFLL